jgi:CHAT domain-containing protein
MLSAKPCMVLSAVIAALLMASAILAQQPQAPPPTRTSSAGEQVSIENLLSALAAAKTEAERQAVIDARRETLTIELRKALIVRGDSLRLQDDFAASLQTYLAAQLVAESIQDEMGVALALLNIGRIYNSLDSYAVSLTFSQKAYLIFEKLGDQNGMAQALNALGLNHGMMGDLNSAMEEYQRSIKLREAIGDKTGLSLTLGNLSHLYYIRTDYELAVESAQRSLKLAEEVGDKLRAAVSLTHLGNAYRIRGNYRAALEAYQRGLKIAGELSGEGNSGDLLNVIGRVYLAQGDYPLAREYFQRSLKLREKVGDKNGMVMSLSTIGSSYLLQGEYQQALQYLQKSLTFQETTAKANVATSLNLIGDVQIELKDYARAEESLRQSLELSDTLGFKLALVGTLNSFARLYLAQAKYPQALEFATRAVTLAEQSGMPEPVWQAHISRGQAYRAMGQTDASRKAFSAAIAAIESLRAYIIGGESNRQNFFQNKLTAYQSMVEMLVSEGKYDEALVYAERAKARVLLDVLHGGRVGINKALTAAESQRERDLNGELSALNAQLMRAREKPEALRLDELLSRQQKARREYEAFQANLYVAHPELAVQRGEARPATLDELSPLVPDTNTALVEFVVAEDRTLLFVITKADQSSPPSGKLHGSSTLSAASDAVPKPNKSSLDLQVYTLNITRAELGQRVADFRQQLARRDILFSPEAKRLYQLLLAPAAPQLQGRTQLIIVPDGALWELPFQALQSTQDEYVVERHALSYAPSFRVLVEMARRRERRGNNRLNTATILAFGNPSLETARSNLEAGARLTTINNTLPALPEAEHQVRALATLYGPRRSRVYIGDEASEEHLKREAGNFRIVHLATHGVIDDRSPLYSYVLLNGSTNPTSSKQNIKAGSIANVPTREDGLLEAWELMQLNLHTEMVVLSACETARGRIGQGEGMIGLSWALFVAGSPTTVASQWKVESASTTELMLSFYRHLQSTPVRSASGNVFKAETKAEALRQASLSLLRSERYSHPFYWAGFVIIGDSN